MSLARDDDRERGLLAEAAGDASSPFVVQGFAALDEIERDRGDWWIEGGSQALLEEMQAGAARQAAVATLFIEWIRGVFTDPNLVTLFENSAKAVLDSAAHQHLVIRESRATLEVMIAQERERPEGDEVDGD
jgi:hypothetical protein